MQIHTHIQNKCGDADPCRKCDDEDGRPRMYFGKDVKKGVREDVGYASKNANSMILCLPAPAQLAVVFGSLEKKCKPDFFHRLLKGTGHFFKFLSVGSVFRTERSQICAFLINNRFQAKKYTSTGI